MMIILYHLEARFQLFRDSVNRSCTPSFGPHNPYGPPVNNPCYNVNNAKYCAQIELHQHRVTVKDTCFYVSLKKIITSPIIMNYVQFLHKIVNFLLRRDIIVTSEVTKILCCRITISIIITTRNYFCTRQSRYFTGQ